MKIAFCKQVITPEINCHIAGYNGFDVAEYVNDDLYMHALCCDDGSNKVLIISLDLLGLEADYIASVREKCAAGLNISPESVMLTCTHTHSGPHTRKAGGYEDLVSKNRDYLDHISNIIAKWCDELDKDAFVEVDTFFYSVKVDENLNRRYISADNRSSYLPYRNELRKIADGFADQELGTLFFMEKNSSKIVYVIGNYAAHPLAGHSPYLGGRRISADYPGFFRNYVKDATGAETMFITGAAGDMVPKNDELGIPGAEKTGVALGQAAVRSIVDASRNAGRFKLSDAKCGSLIREVKLPIRKCLQGTPKLCELYRNSDHAVLHMQFVAIGDICLVGVPGELCAELGLEMKWHSPFRRTFIAYASTAYFNYLCPANFLVAGGYEAMNNLFSARSSIELVRCAVDGMFDLRDQMFPHDAAGQYPDCREMTLVDLPANE